MPLARDQNFAGRPIPMTWRTGSEDSHYQGVLETLGLEGDSLSLSLSLEKARTKSDMWPRAQGSTCTCDAPTIKRIDMLVGPTCSDNFAAPDIKPQGRME